MGHFSPEKNGAKRLKLTRYVWCLCVLLGLTGTIAMGQQQAPQDCTQYDHSFPLNVYSSYAQQQHSSGADWFDHTTANSCSYSGTPSPTGPVGCAVSASSVSQSGAQDVGSLSALYILDTHYASVADAQGGTSAANGASATADSEGAAAFQSCLFSCGTNISISGQWARRGI